MTFRRPSSSLPAAGRRLAAGLTVTVAGLIGVAAALQARPLPPMPVPKAKMTPVPKNAPPLEKGRAVNYLGDRYSDIAATGMLTLQGHAVLESDGTRMRSDLLRYNRNTFVGDSPGKVFVDDDNNSLTGDKGTAYYQKREAVLHGNVKIVIRPKPGAAAAAPKDSPRRQFHEPVTITCDDLVYDWRQHIAVCTGHLKLVQVTSEGVTRTATAKKLVYEGDPQRATFTGDVHATDTKGQQFDAQFATAILREGAEEFHVGSAEQPGAKGLILIPDDDADGGGPAAPGGKLAAPPAGGAPAAAPAVSPTPTASAP